MGSSYEWKQSASSTYQTVYRRMLDCNLFSLADLMADLARDTEKELVEIDQMLVEMNASGWDMPHILEMN